MFAAVSFVGTLAALSWAGWRLARRWLEESHPRSETSILVLSAYGIASTLVVLITAGLGGFGLLPIGLLSRGPFLIVTAVVLITVLYTTRDHGALAPGSTGSHLDRGVNVVVVLALAAIATDVALAFGSAPNNWDAMTYHLFLPARWLQEGSLVHVPTVFGDNAAAYAPQNGALLFAASMLLLGSDAATNVMQLLALGASGIAVYSLSRRLDAGRVAASLAGAIVFFVGPLRELAFSANVDVWMSSFWIVAVALLAYSLRVESTAAIVCAGLVTGLVAGTKTLGLTLALLLTAVALLPMLRHRRIPAALGLLVLFLALTLVGGGFWYTNNLLLYDNPLFPLDLILGPLHLAGAYGVEAVRAGEFHLDTVGRVLANVARFYGLTVVGLAPLAAVSLVMAIFAARRNRSAAWVAAILLTLAAIWSGWFVLGVPHNDQARFLLPSLLVLLPGLSLPIDWLLRRSQVLGWAVGVATLVVVLLSSHPIDFWREAIDTLNAAKVRFEPILALMVLTLGSTLSAWLLRRRHARARLWHLASVAACLWFVLLTIVATEANEDSRVERLKRSEFSGWAESALWLHDPEAPPATIAYSGANVPYILMGRRFRHRVLYVNTRGEPDDGFFEHWQRDGRRTYAYHKPGLYRGDDPEVWLANLGALAPSALYLFTLHPTERRYLLHTPEGFPLESVWASSRPDLFRPILSGSYSEVFAIEGFSPSGVEAQHNPNSIYEK